MSIRDIDHDIEQLSLALLWIIRENSINKISCGVNMMNIKKAFIASVIGVASIVANNASASTFGFEKITNNGNPDISKQLTLDVTKSGENALFTINNLGPIASSIAQVYFDFGSTHFFALPTLASTLYTTTVVVKDKNGNVISTTTSSSSNGKDGTTTKTTGSGTTKKTTITTTNHVTTPATNGGIAYSASNSSPTGVKYADGGTPNNLPGGNSMLTPFTADDMGSAKNPSPINGVNPKEWVAFIGTFSNGDYDSLISAIGSKDFRVGLHIQSIGCKEGSDSYVNTNVSPVPLPAALPLMLSGLGVLGFASRRRKEEV